MGSKGGEELASWILERSEVVKSRPTVISKSQRRVTLNSASDLYQTSIGLSDSRQQNSPTVLLISNNAYSYLLVL